jgi:hypothetical protein
VSYIVYACNKNGEGYSQKVGVYEELGDILIRVALFAPDVVLEIEESDKEVAKIPSIATPAPTASSTIPNIKLK